jgi:hypothetical protein
VSWRAVGLHEFGEIGCAVAPMPLPRSEGRGPAEAVALKFSPDCFRGCEDHIGQAYQSTPAKLQHFRSKRLVG